jgi:hypothetical protein
LDLKRISLLMFCLGSLVRAQSVIVRDAQPVTMPGQVDSNSPAFWRDGELHLLNSTGDGPLLSSGADQATLGRAQASLVARQRQWPTWIEAVWVDPSGSILGFYHQEHENICGAQRPAMPQIGFALSSDGGKTFFDQGVILSSGDPVDCSSQNGYFAGGHGDFSVVPDQNREYFYILFSNYGGPLETQGVVIARMKYEDRFHPAGNVWKYYEGEWTQPGLGGRTTPIFPAKVSWQDADTDSFWGPSVHWNTFLNSYAVLLNRSCCSPGFPQEGVYASFNVDIANPAGWTPPKRILSDVGWYPQILGLGPGETDSIAGRTARLYVFGESRWELIFRRPRPPVPAVEPVPDAPEPTLQTEEPEPD